MVKINHKPKILLGELDSGDTFLYHGVLGIIVEAWCNACACTELRAINIETGEDMEENDKMSLGTIVEKVDIEINIL